MKSWMKAAFLGLYRACHVGKWEFLQGILAGSHARFRICGFTVRRNARMLSNHIRCKCEGSGF